MFTILLTITWLTLASIAGILILATLIMTLFAALMWTMPKGGSDDQM